MAFKNLILFAGGQPFRDLHTFLRTEIAYLSPHFEKVFVLVNSKETPSIALPENVYLEGVSVELSLSEKWIGLSKLGNREVRNELQFYSHQKPKKLKAIKSIFNQFNAAKKYALQLKSFLSQHQLTLEDQSNLFYSYWTDYRTIALALLKKEQPKMKFICRMHGWDLYKERHEEKYLPYRKLINQQANSIVFISENGKKYFESALQTTLSNAKVKLLGTPDCGINPDRTSKALKLVSCSFSVSLKRVELIAYALKEINDIEIEWTHIGSGPSQSYFEKEVNRTLTNKANIKYRFLGLISNKEVIELYQAEHFDLFVNTSEFEGIPIGMMEAMSFGIPCLGTNTGGVNEIITENENGFLVSQYPKIGDVADTIKHFHELSNQELENFRKNARMTWESKFHAKKNYESFIQDIFTLANN